MTLFDWIAAFVFLVSGLMGFARGATREVTTVIAFIVAAVFAVFALRLTGPIARHAIHIAWMANTVAILIGFVLAYVILRMLGGMLTRSVRATVLSGPDRALGFAIGLVRGWVAIGVFALLINAATPPERMPAWIVRAHAWPLAQAAGAALRAFAPQGLRVAHEVAPAMAAAVTGARPDTPRATSARHPHGGGYSDDERHALDALVEKTR